MKRNVAVVTGASRGVGKAILTKLAENGYHVWACSSRKTLEFEVYISELSARTETWIEPLYFDLCNQDEIKDAYKSINKKNREIDVLINNAGIGHMGLFQMTSMKEVERIYRVNILAPMLLSQLVLRNMQRQGYGRIINVASTAASEVYEGNAVYGSSKAALVSFTKSFAAEVYKYGVTANAIAPGLIDTQMSKVFEGKDPEEPMRHTALGRKIRPEEIADIVFSLLSEEMAIINGEVIYINGGHK